MTPSLREGVSSYAPVPAERPTGVSIEAHRELGGNALKPGCGRDNIRARGRFLQRERNSVVERELEPSSACRLGVRPQRSPRVAEVALQQSLPEGDVEIGAERAPERLDRGR